MPSTKEVTIEKKIFAYNITTETTNLHDAFNKYVSLLGDDRNKIKERNLLYRNPEEDISYFLDMNKITIKTLDNNDKDKLTCAFNGTIYRLRENDLPLILDLTTGNKKGIELNANSSIVEQTHFLVFPEINLLLSEFNNFGARVEKLRSIIDSILSLNSYDIQITHLLRTDNYKTIIEAKELKELEFKLGHTGLKTLKDIVKLNLFDDLNATFDELSNFNVTIKLSGKRNKYLLPTAKEKFSKALIKLSENIISKRNDGTIKTDDVSRIRTKIYDDENTIPVDLLEEKLVHTIEVVKLNPRYKYLNSDDMFEKLLKLYKNNTFAIDRHVPIE